MNAQNNTPVDHTVYLQDVRISFPKLIEAVISPLGGEPKFGCDLILEMNDPQVTTIMSEIHRSAVEKWKDVGPSVIKMVQADRLKRCYGHGSEKIKKETMAVLDGYEGKFYLSANANQDRPPVIASADTGKLIDNGNTLERQAAARKIYGGCYVNAAVKFWMQDNQFGKGIRCQLSVIQFNRDGTAFGEAPADHSGMFKPTVQGVPSAPAGGELPDFLKLPF